jgi:hypothetical protein
MRFHVGIRVSLMVNNASHLSRKGRGAAITPQAGSTGQLTAATESIRRGIHLEEIIPQRWTWYYKHL